MLTLLIISCLTPQGKVQMNVPAPNAAECAKAVAEVAKEKMQPGVSCTARCADVKIPE